MNTRDKAPPRPRLMYRLPWSWKEYGAAGRQYCIVYDDDGHGIPGLYGLHQETASRIVLAVNNFSPLRDALAALLDTPHDTEAQKRAAKVLAESGEPGQ